jgi:hypothetical protein
MIVTCGFVSSGTRLLHQIVDHYMGVPAVHRSFPHWDRFWWPDDEWFDGATWIVIHRIPEYAFRSALDVHHPGLPDGTVLSAPIEEIRSWYPRWQAAVARMRNPYHVQYEELVRSPRKTIDDLASYLRVDTPLRSYPEVRDENVKYE